MAIVATTASWRIRWKTTRILESYGELTRDTASQLQRSLGPDKGPGIFLRMRHEAVETGKKLVTLWLRLCVRMWRLRPSHQPIGAATPRARRCVTSPTHSA
jgi:hypothetical protein